jgi:NADH-quinone oxidoreductase subunit E
MARLTAERVERARQIIDRYPEKRSAMLPLLHLAQEQDGYVAEDAMEHLAELLDLTPSTVLSTASFYTMFKLEPVGRYLVSICTNIACLLDGAYELLEHAEDSLGTKAGHTTDDGEYTIEEVECLALCDQAPCMQVNYRYFEDVTPGRFDEICADLQAGTLTDIPPHGVVIRGGPVATSWQSAGE